MKVEKKLWKWEEKDFNSMWVSEVSNKFTKNEMEIEKPEALCVKIRTSRDSSSRKM